jgi:GAF domain-containing protein
MEVRMSKLEMSPEILETLRELSSLLESEDSFERTLRSVVDLAASTLPACDSAGITLRVNGKYSTAAASDLHSLEIDNIQYDAGEGPCLTALELGEPQRIEAVSEETRWPEFTARASRDGFGSSASFPLSMNGTPGALNLYAKSERAFDHSTTAIAEIFARQAATALNNAHIYAAARKLSDQLNEALKSRDLIGQAKGILMEREGISDAEAFEMLKRISQTTNVKLRDVAARLTEQQTRR